MSICQIGIDSKAESANVCIYVGDSHPLLKLATFLPWKRLADKVLPDLMQTEKGFWWLGRRLILRIHLAIFILQSRFNLTDRDMEEQLKYNAAFQIFCGRYLAGKWRVPDHTAICKFRSRLCPETQRSVLICVVKAAKNAGFADPSWMDLDSTVQEANITYPSDASLMLKLAKDSAKVAEWLAKNLGLLTPQNIRADLKSISSKAKEYFFLAKNTTHEKKREVFRVLHRLVKKNTYQLIENISRIDPANVKLMPSNLRDLTTRILRDGRRYLLDVAHFIRSGNIKKTKLLSFHAREVACLPKGKVGKPFEFGRVFQIGRIGGNFLIPLACTSVRMEDKHSVLPMIEEHISIFGEDCLESLCTDKGYYSKANVRGAFHLGVKEVGLQKPGVKGISCKPQHELDALRLRDRRAGIEPLIGHAKRFGLKKSRMKSDASTLASGYRSILGFNLRQLERHQAGMMKKTS